MKNLASFIAICFAISFANGQSSSVNLETFSGQGQLGSVFAEMRKKKNIQSDLPTVGSVYIDGQFLPCKVYYKNELVGAFYYRHNAFNDEIEIKDTNLEEEHESSLATIKELRLINPLGNKELALKTYKNKQGEVRNGYLYLLIDGHKYDLYTKNNVKFTEGTHAISSMVRDTPNKFSQFTEYYFVANDDKVAQYIGSKKSDFIKSFDKGIRENLSGFVKKEKISIKEETDLMKTFQYLNTL